MTLLLLTLMSFTSPVRQFAIEGHLEPPGTLNTRISQDRIWIANTGACTIQVFDMQGQKIRSFGGKGQGPGEILVFMGFGIMDGGIYVNDGSKLSLFDRNGEFTRTLSIPSDRLHLQRVADGWVFPKDHDILGKEDRGGVFWAGNHFKDTVRISDARTETAEPTMKNPVYSFNTNPEEVFICITPDGKRALIRRPDPNIVFEIFDVHQKKVAGQIKKEIKLIPFDKQGMEKTYQDFKAQLTGKLKIVNALPDFYPSVGGARLLQDGLLYVWQDASRKAKNRVPVFAFHPETGDETPQPFSTEAFHRILGYQDGLYLISTFNSKTETGGIALCRKDQVNAFVKANPIKNDHGENDE